MRAVLLALGLVALSAPVLAQAADPTADAVRTLLDGRDRAAGRPVVSDDIASLRAILADRDARIAALQAQVDALSPPPQPNAPTISVGDVAVAPGQRSVTIPVTLSEPTDHTITAKWMTANGAGTWNQYVAASGLIVWQPGEKTKAVTVALTKDLTAAQNVQVNIIDVPGYPGSVRTKGRGLISGGAQSPAAPVVADATAMPGPPTGKTLAWSQDFADEAFCVTDTGKDASGKPCWQGRPTHGLTQDASRELGLYASPDRFPNVTMTGIGTDGKRFIQLERHPEGFSEGGKPILHSWDQKPFGYSSAMIQGAKLPTVIGQGSYVEARLKLDLVQGTWPAFWLMPANGSWPPEIDIFEGFWNAGRIGKDALTTTVHWRNLAGTHVQYGVDAPLATLLPGFDVRDWHTYGVFIERDWLTFYVDGVPTVRTPNPTTRGAKWYPLLDVTTGGAVGEPAPDAPLPAKMGLDWLKVWN